MNQQLTSSQLDQQHLGKHQLEACRKKAPWQAHGAKGFGRRKQPVIAVNNKGEEVVTSFKNCDKQGWTFLIFADKNILSLKSYEKLS